MDRKRIMQRLDRLEPREWYIEDLAESYIEVYGMQGVEEVIQENGIEYIKELMKKENVSAGVRETVEKYFVDMARKCGINER